MSEFTSEQEIALRQERFIRTVLKIRNKENDDPWMRLFHSPVIAAIITVVFGTLGASIITTQIQIHAKARELQTLQFQESLNNQRKVASDASALIGKVEAAAEDMATITESRFDTSARRGLSPKDRKNLEDQKLSVIDKYDNAESEWRERRDTLAMLFSLYHHNDPGVMASWSRTSSALTSFIDCERSFEERMYRESTITDDDSTKTICYDPEKKNLIEAEKALVQSIVVSEKQ